MFESREGIHSGEEAVTGIEARQALGGLPGAGNFLNHELVLFPFKRARGIHQAAAGAQMLERLTNQSYLLGVEVGQVARLESPLDLGIAAESAGAGTRRVHQNTIEKDAIGAERQRVGAVEHDQRAVEIAHLFQPVQVDVAGDGAGSQLDGLRGFVAGRGAKIEERVAGVRIEQRHDGLRADILDAAGARDVALGWLEERGGDSIGCVAAELAIPFVDQPSRHGQFGGAIGPGYGLAIRFSQNRVDQAGRRCFVRALHQLNAFADGGVRRDAIEIAQLVDAHAESDADLVVKRARCAQGDQIIELGLVAEASEDNFGGERGVARVEMRAALQQKVRSVTAVVDFLENIESDLARGGDQVLF